MKLKTKWASNFKLTCGATGVCIYSTVETADELLSAEFESAVLDGDGDGFLSEEQESELVDIIAKLSSTQTSSSDGLVGLSEQERK